MRIALLGGSFNPPHVAHQMICLWVLSTEQADQLWLMPCYHHPFGKELVDFGHRVEMCQLASAIFPPGRVSVCTIESELGGEGRTLFTLQALRERHPEHSWRLVIGADILQEASAWYRFDEVQRLAPPLVLGRTGYPSPEGAPVLPQISSTRIREALRRGEDPVAWVPAAVRAYVQQHQLYSGHAG